MIIVGFIFIGAIFLLIALLVALDPESDGVALSLISLAIILSVLTPFMFDIGITARDVQRDLKRQGFILKDINTNGDPSYVTILVQDKNYRCEVVHKNNRWIITSLNSCKEINVPTAIAPKDFKK